MTDLTVLAEQIAEAIARRPVIPAAQQLWDADGLAAYFVVTRRAALERYAALPSFPRPIRIELADGKTSRPRWKAAEVMAWAERHQERPTPESRNTGRK
jgi:predicted DNA-binding transcriptional regulator AlpA